MNSANAYEAAFFAYAEKHPADALGAHAAGAAAALEASGLVVIEADDEAADTAVEIIAAATKAASRSSFYSFADCLRMAWYDAKVHAAADAERASDAARIAADDVMAAFKGDAVNLLDAVQAARLAAIRSELQAMEYSDAPTNWDRHRELSVELFELA